MREPCLCGALDCKWCYPMTWRQHKRELAHEHHDDPDMEMDDCPECHPEWEYDPPEVDRWERDLLRKERMHEEDYEWGEGKGGVDEG